MEQAASDASRPNGFGETGDLLDQVIVSARIAYRRVMDKVQPVFVKQVEGVDWPPGNCCQLGDTGYSYASIVAVYRSDRRSVKWIGWEKYMLAGVRASTG